MARKVRTRPDSSASTRRYSGLSDGGTSVLWGTGADAWKRRSRSPRWKKARSGLPHDDRGRIQDPGRLRNLVAEVARMRPRKGAAHLSSDYREVLIARSAACPPWDRPPDRLPCIQRHPHRAGTCRSGPMRDSGSRARRDRVPADLDTIQPAARTPFSTVVRSSTARQFELRQRLACCGASAGDSPTSPRAAVHELDPTGVVDLGVF